MIWPSFFIIFWERSTQKFKILPSWSSKGPPENFKFNKKTYKVDRKMIRPPFFIIFSGLFTQTKKNQLWPWRWMKGPGDFFSKIFKKKLSKSTAPRKHKIKRLRGQSHFQLIIKGTFRHGKRILRFVITMIDK